MSDADSPATPQFRPRKEAPMGTIVGLALVVLVAAYFGWRWYQQQQLAPLPTAPVAVAPTDAPPSRPRLKSRRARRTRSRRWPRPMPRCPRWPVPMRV